MYLSGEDGIPAVKDRSHTPAVWVQFSHYELANMVEMFKAVMPWRHGITLEGGGGGPFSALNTGDWTGQVNDRLEEAYRLYAHGTNPNQPATAQIANALLTK